MAQICVTNLTFYYEGSFEPVFEKVSFSLDTDWKCGFLGRNGKGKTTFLRLLREQGALSGRCEGSIICPAVPDYFPYPITEEQKKRPAAEFLEELKAGCELWRVLCELEKLGEDAGILYRPFWTLSPGERTKIQLAALFSEENDFFLIDEPTNHLDRETRESVKGYLLRKKGFLLVSHDRDLLDACVDHVLVLNRGTIEVQNGNFSSWWENKRRKDHFAEAENEKHLKEIGKLKQAAARASGWADKNEGMKIGYDPARENDRFIGTRAYIGAKTKKMQSRVKQMEKRIRREVEEKEDLLVDLEKTDDLKMTPLRHHRERLVDIRDYGLAYSGAEKPLFTGLTGTVQRGERVALHGGNGCGKTTLIRMILQKAGYFEQPPGRAEGLFVSGSSRETGISDDFRMLPRESGVCETASGMVISYVNQDTSRLKGGIFEFCRERNLDESIFCALLRKFGLERVQFEKKMEDYSAGQKKKVLLAASLLTPAHLYVWDEPLNDIDVFSRMQVEKLLSEYSPTMLFVEHDVRFRETIATKTIVLSDDVSLLT
ncbi:MAG: ABC-F family ATP-binding cassette domain-containing protein [Lachnospiraceae bacterium]|nr:ABC-F family ATP-binding cassette domain-containing protein [Lachnospiraceae bacterium]